MDYERYIWVRKWVRVGIVALQAERHQHVLHTIYRQRNQNSFFLRCSFPTAVPFENFL